MQSTSEKISFMGSKGQIGGTLDLPSDGAVRGAVVLAHCFACGRNSLAASRLARYFAANGIATLRFDFAGIGDSEGDFAATGLVSNAEDIIAAAAELSRRAMPVDFLVGHSYGGAATIAAAEHVASVTHVVTIGAPHDVGHVIESIGSSQAEIAERGEADFSLFGRTLKIGSTFLEQASNSEQQARLSRFSKSLLVLHSPDDEIVPFSQAQSIFAAAGSRDKSFVALNGVSHLATRDADIARIGSIILSWLPLPPAEAVPSVQGIRPLPSTIRVRTDKGKFAQIVQSEKHDWIADEPRTVGGDDRGPTPYDHLLAALGTCTSMTIALYAQRKGIPLEAVEIELEHGREHSSDCVACDDGGVQIDVLDRSIRLHGELSTEQRSRLMQIADRCPVHRTLESRIEIKTI